MGPAPRPNEWTRLAPRPRALSGGDKWNVFLSYRSVNRPWVLNLYDVLCHLGHTVFIDQCSLAAGEQWIGRLQTALEASQAGVLIWSSQTADSEWVSRECQTLERMAGGKIGFQFVTVVLDQAPLPAFLNNRVYLDFSAYPDGPNGGELLRLLYAVAGQPLSAEAARFASSQDDAAKEAAAKIGAAIQNGDPARLTRLFDEGGLAWETSAALGCKAAEGLARLNRNDDALAMLEQIRRRFPRAIRPRQLTALALARRGREGGLGQAQEILGELYARGERDPETLGIYARTWMDRYAQSGDPGDLAQSRDLYAEAFDRAPDDYYTGINAAAKSVLMGTKEDLEKAADFAAKVQKIVGTEARRGDYWMTATVAEVYLIQKRYADAARLYRDAVAIGRKEIASHLTTWKQACRLMEKLQPRDLEREMVRTPFAHLPDCGRF